MADKTAYEPRNFSNGGVPVINSTYLNGVEIHLSNTANNMEYEPDLDGGVTAKDCVIKVAGTWEQAQDCDGVVDGYDNVVMSGGICTGLTSLTAGLVYYSSSASELTSTVTQYEVGVALSTTELFVHIRQTILIVPIALTDAAKTLALSDSFGHIECDRGTAQTITIPPNSDVAFPIGTWVSCIQLGVGVVSFAEGIGVTILPATLDITAVDKTCAVYKQAINTWIIAGSVE